DSGAATDATLAHPGAVAYDASGNLYLADTNNHVVREIAKSTGVITTVAGDGTEGFSGDGGAATSAQLDTPTGVAVDSSGNLYIADTHNQRIREVSGGTITTIAGNGTAGYSGDGAAATAAELSTPAAVAVGTDGSVYIADTNNHSIRKISAGIITTIAGTGLQGYAGDGGAATSALLDTPIAIAVDASNNLYIADRHNQRVREVLASGTITTLAGTGTPTFSGGFAGDGAAAASASLASPTGVSVDGSGNVFVADTNNQRLRQISGATIATLFGDGTQDPTTLNAPRSVVSDATGNLALADTLNQTILGLALPTLTFASSQVGEASAAQTITLANTGSASITVASLSFAGTFALASGGSCSAAPITLAAGASCTQNIAFLPTVLGAASGEVTVSGSGVVSQSVLLTGTATQGTSSLALATTDATPDVNESVTLTATVAANGSGTAPTGTVAFSVNGAAVGSATVANSAASLAYTFTSAGSYTVSASYSGDANYAGSTATVAENVTDFSLASASGSASSASVQPGASASFSFTATPLNGAFNTPISFSASGLPDGATATFSPASLTLGSSPGQVTVTIQTPATTALLRRAGSPMLVGMGMLFLLAPFGLKANRRLRAQLLLVCLSLGGLLTLGSLAGCGSSSGFFAQPSKSYTIEITGSATTASGSTLQHVTTVTLTVQ
ncbi:Ig-like domain repeat protein, partial [Silvibacterium sp.]|uniref:NHL domain-containing protein n=1 Tax=Silvibacterium sp. TaxID=1964179 RepID=UPI0039E50917